MTRAGLVLPPVLLCLLDVGLTLAGQPAAYWAGDAARVDEFNPVGRVFLVVSPWLFLAFGLGWATAFVTVLLSLPRRCARPFASLLTVGHTLRAAGWLLKYGWPGVAAVVLLAGVILTLGRGGRTGPTAVCPNDGERVQ